MTRITALNSHPARPGKLRVYIDEKYAFELSRKSINALKVVEDEELTTERRQELEAAATREAAIGLLARRERSKAELRSALRRKGFDPKLIEEVLASIGREGMQSDERFADAWVGTRRRLSPRGRAALAFELRQKGIADAESKTALAKYKPAEEREAIHDLIAARVERFKGDKAEKEKFKRRLLGFLSRRGFAYEDIRSVLATDFPDWL